LKLHDRGVVGGKLLADRQGLKARLLGIGQAQSDRSLASRLWWFD
jgi:hypothetical protein